IRPIPAPASAVLFTMNATGTDRSSRCSKYNRLTRVKEGRGCIHPSGGGGGGGGGGSKESAGAAEGKRLNKAQTKTAGSNSPGCAEGHVPITAAVVRRSGGKPASSGVPPVS